MFLLWSTADTEKTYFTNMLHTNSSRFTHSSFLLKHSLMEAAMQPQKQTAKKCARQDFKTCGSRKCSVATVLNLEYLHTSNISLWLIVVYGLHTAMQSR